MRFKLEIQADTYEEFIDKANDALRNVSRGEKFKELIVLSLPMTFFSFNYGKFTITRSKVE
jgi:hypothetical protein